MARDSERPVDVAPEVTLREGGARRIFTAERFTVLAADKEEAILPAAGPEGWRWIGDSGVLEGIGVAENGAVENVSFGRIAGGRDAEGRAVIRKPTTVKENGQYVRGLVQVKGSLQASAELAAAYRDAGPKARQEIREDLMSQAKAGIGELAGTDQFAATASVVEVGEGAELAPRVDWIALGADRGGVLGGPYDRNRLKAITRQVDTPFETSVASPTPELPTQPLRDILSIHRELLGAETVQELKVQADAVRSELDLGRFSDEELRRWLPERDPFEGVRRNPGPLGSWPEERVDVAVRTAALEGQLIDNAAGAYADLAMREQARRNDRLANPLAAVQEARGDVFATKVGRRAAVLASNIDRLSEDQRRARTKAIHEVIQATGIDAAPFDALAQAVALQHSRNIVNERQAAQQLETAQEPVAAIEAAAAEPGGLDFA